ncbi:MAG TPA: hypothetical protein VMB18_18085 [Terriglobales bacterium]|nr:hypothetical protein [Terriglobales bacterium]
MKPCRLFCFLVIFGCALSQAQKFVPPTAPPTDPQIQTWLRSEDPQSVAWGAHYVLATKNQALTSDLLSLAYSWQPLPKSESNEAKRKSLTNDEFDRRDAMSAVLDVLIQMRVSVPRETLQKLAPDFPNYVAVLLSRLPVEESTPLALDLYRSAAGEGYGLQYVGAAMLAQNPPPGFAANLFSSIHNRASVFVVVPGTGEIGGGTAGDCFQSDSSAPRAQWPAFGSYRLSKESSDESLLVVPGSDPIYAIRSETTRYIGQSCAGRVYLGAEERRRLLAQMLNVDPEAIAWQTKLQLTIEFKSDQQFASDLQTFITAQQEKYRATAAALEVKGLMTSAEEDHSLPQLDIQLRDMRGHDYAAISPPSPLPPQVAIANPWH